MCLQLVLLPLEGQNTFKSVNIYMNNYMAMITTLLNIQYVSYATRGLSIKTKERNVLTDVGRAGWSSWELPLQLLIAEPDCREE